MINEISLLLFAQSILAQFLAKVKSAFSITTTSHRTTSISSLINYKLLFSSNVLAKVTPQSATAMSDKSTAATNGDARKDKTNGRLQSIFTSSTTRDLSLVLTKTNQRAQNSKRTYTPNLNAVRQKQT